MKKSDGYKTKTGIAAGGCRLRFFFCFALPYQDSNLDKQYQKLLC